MRDHENQKYIKLGITGVAVVAVSLLCFFVLFRLRDILAAARVVLAILTPFVYGAVIAYILAPICGRVERFLSKVFRIEPDKMGAISGLSIVITLLGAMVLLWALVMLVFPQVWRSIVGIANTIPGQLDAASKWLHDLLKSQPEWQTYWDGFSQRATQEIINWFKKDILPTMGTMVEELGSQLAVFVGTMKNVFLGVLISVYFLISRKRFAAQARLLVNGIFPRHAAAIIEEEVRYADKMFNGFLMGKLLDSAIIGVICFIGTTLMGIRSAALVSVIVGVTNIIPFFGPFIGAIPCAILLVLENPLHCVYFVIFVIILQQVDGNLIGPRILGNSTGLSSFWVLFSILLFGGMWGIVGMIVGVPLFAVIYDIVRRLTFFGLRRHGRGEMLSAYNDEFHGEERDAATRDEAGGGGNDVATQGEVGGGA